MESQNNAPRLPPPWITPAAGNPNRDVQPMIIIPRRRTASYTPTDADAIPYLSALATADGAAPGAAVKQAVDTYFQALKSNSLWTLINQIYLFCGATTLAGALTAAKGSNPTNNGFGSGDYNQKLGLSGNGTSKYLSINTASNSVGATHHFSVTCSGGMETSGDKIAVGSYNGSTGTSLLSLDLFGSGGVNRAFRSGTFTAGQFPTLSTGLGASGYLCGSRTASNAAFVNFNGTTASSSQTIFPSFITGSPFLYALNNNGSPNGHSAMSLQIFTRGEGLTTAQSATLRSINNAYIAAIAAL